jgi:thioredoxin-like negative regulator of GroEL
MKKFIYFTSPTCGPCRTYGPIISALNVPVEKIDITIDMDTAVSYGIKAVPTTILVKDGVEVWKNVGVTTLQTLQDAYDRN